VTKSAPARIGIVTVSDRASRGEYQDRGGPALRAHLETRLAPGWIALPRLVPDEKGEIEAVLIELADREGCALVVTTGGTGPAPRDVTPEATEAVLTRALPGFAERMRAVSVATVPSAILSRAAAGIRGKTLIVNLPGSPRGAVECLETVLPAIPHCLELIGAAGIALAGGPATDGHR
jgi:molybdopterin adenylyltransferase